MNTQETHPREEKDYTSDPEVVLMLEFQKGDTGSFETLLRKYFPRIFNYVYRLVGSRETAEDLTQETFIRVYRAAASYQPRAKFQTWIFTVARNLALNELRRLKRKTFSLDAEREGKDGTMAPQREDPSARTADEQLLLKERREQVRRAVDSLPENQRTAVVLRRFEGFSYEQIARTLGLSVSAVKSLLSRAKDNLKEKLSVSAEVVLK